MPTTTDLTTLKINYLSQAQYDNALANNQINPNELYFTPADVISSSDTGAETINKWVSRIQQSSTGAITATMASLDTSGTWSGNAATATKATQDGSGNNIVNTYLTKAAGVTAVSWDLTNKKLTRTINDTAADVLQFVAGTGITLTAAADSLTIANSGVRSIATGSTNGTISVNTNGTTENVAVKGLDSAAYQSDSRYKTRITGTKNLSTAGWYRILDCTTYSMAFLITFYGGYTYYKPTPVTFLVSHDYNSTSISQIGRSAYISQITKIRAIHHDTSKFYIDIYYAGNNNNQCGFEVTPLDPTSRSSITKIDYTAITDELTSNAECSTDRQSRADKFYIARSLKTKLDSTTAVTFDGSADQDAIPVTGTLPIGNGGTGATTADGARANLGLGSMATETAANYIPKSIGTTKGDIIYWSAANTPAQLGIGSVGQVLKVSSDGVPVWSSDNNSDTKVSQSETTTSNWRKVLLAYNSSSSPKAAVVNETNVAYVSTGLEYQPSTGTLAVTSLKVLGSANSSAQLKSDSSNNMYVTINNKTPLVLTDTAVRSGTSAAGTINLGTSTVKWNYVYANYFNGDGSALTSLNASNIASGTIGFARLPSIYWANIAATDVASYSTTPEVAKVKINGNTAAAAASSKNVELVYDSTLEVLNFVFT